MTPAAEEAPLRRRIILATGLLLALLTGCASITSQQLRDDPGEVFTFDVAHPYQAVYRTILAQARTCFPSPGMFVTIVVDGDLYTDTASGQIAVDLYASGRQVAVVAYDVTALPTGQTRVRGYAYSHDWGRRARAAQSWVTSGAKDC
jgi:hypothetical protein